MVAINTVTCALLGASPLDLDLYRRMAKLENYNSMLTAKYTNGGRSGGKNSQDISGMANKNVRKRQKEKERPKQTNRQADRKTYRHSEGGGGYRLYRTGTNSAQSTDMARHISQSEYNINVDTLMNTITIKGKATSGWLTHVCCYKREEEDPQETPTSV